MLFQGIELAGISSSSRNIKPGYAFVAVKGKNTDGNNYIQDAINRGAKIIITDDNRIDIQANIPLFVVEDSRKILAQLISEYYGEPWKSLNIIGVTGTNGKTTTTFMLERLFKQAGFNTGLIGTTCIKSRDKLFLPKLTTPSPEDLHKYLKQMVDDRVDIVSMEASSHGLKQQRLYGIQFDCAIQTNISVDHMDYHTSVKDYVDSKKMLFDQIKPGGIAIINSDDRNASKLIKDKKDIIVIDYGLNNRASITASSLDFTDGASFTFCQQRAVKSITNKLIEPQEIPVKLNVLGKHNVYNALAAMTCGLLYDVPIESMLIALKRFRGVSRRAEIIYNEDFMVVDDYCHNPASYQALFEAIQPLDYTNVHLICAIRGNRGMDINSETAKLIGEWDKIIKFKTIITTNSIDVITKVDWVSSKEMQAFIGPLSNQRVSHVHRESLRDAINYALDICKKGDLILLTGAQGMDEGRHILLSQLNKDSHIEIQQELHLNQTTFISNILKIDN